MGKGAKALYENIKYKSRSPSRQPSVPSMDTRGGVRLRVSKAYQGSTTEQMLPQMGEVPVQWVGRSKGPPVQPDGLSEHPQNVQKKSS